MRWESEDGRQERGDETGDRSRATRDNSLQDIVVFD